MRLFPHIHRDPNWEIRGCHKYFECRCGARRLARAYSNLSGPIEAGWPSLVDKHGRWLHATKWIKQSDIVGVAFGFREQPKQAVREVTNGQQ